MLPRFFLDQLPTGPLVSLSPSESHHLMHVRRIPAGAEVELFDGEGNAYRAVVTRLHRGHAELSIVQALVADIPTQPRLVLGVAFPKADRQKFLIEKCVELGVATLVPLVSERSVAKIDSGGLDRLRRLAIEACKQCGRNRLIELAAAQDLQTFLQSAPHTSVRWFADLDGTRAPGIQDMKPDTHLYAAVGPEGGWSARERGYAEACGWQPIRISSFTLRTETAAIVIAGWCAAQSIPRVTEEVAIPISAEIDVQVASETPSHFEEIP